MSRTPSQRNEPQTQSRSASTQTQGRSASSKTQGRSSSVQNKGAISSSDLRVRHRPTARGLTQREIDAYKARGSSKTRHSAPDSLLTRIIDFFNNNRMYAVAGAILLLIILTVLIAFIAQCSSKPQESESGSEPEPESTSVTQQTPPQINLPKQTTTYVKTPSAFNGGEDGVLCIVLDPGHGGEDSGASADELEEKDLTLRVAQYCKEELEKCPDIKVYLTRTSDHDASLDDRVAYAVGVNADLLVSLHIDDIDVTTEHGATVYYPNEGSTLFYDETVPVGKYAAECILQELVSLGLKSNGVREARLTPEQCSPEDWERYRYDDDSNITDYFAITRIARREGLPGLVVEHCYLSDENDTARLRFESFVQALGQADARGILACYGYIPIEDFEARVVNDSKATIGNVTDSAEG